MTRDKMLALLLLKQVLWGVRRGTTTKGICGAFNMRASRYKQNARRKGIDVELGTLITISKVAMAEACKQLGWEMSAFPVPDPNGKAPHQAYCDAYKNETLWEGRYGMKRMRLLCRMIWVLKTEIFMEKAK